MKKKSIITLILTVMLILICTSCNSSVPTSSPTTDNQAPSSTITTESTTTEITTLPPSSEESPEPVHTPVAPDMFNNTYWINSSLGIAYFFKEDGTATVFMTEKISEVTYSFNETELTIDGMSIPYSIKDTQLIISYFEGLDVTLDKATENQFKELINEPDITPDITADSNYVGLTVKEFVKTGAEISGYMGVNGEYEFSAYNSQKNEKYTFSLTGGNVKDALNSKTFDNEYEDVLGDFVISKITVIKLDDSDLQKHVGKTVAVFEAEGFEIKGYIYSMNLTLLAYDKNNNCVEITLNGNASEVYEGLEDPFDEDMGEVFAQFTIKSIKYSKY